MNTSQQGLVWKAVYPSIFGNHYVISENMNIIGSGGTKKLAQGYKVSQYEVLTLLNHNQIHINDIQKALLLPNTKDRGGYPRITMELTKTAEQKYQALLDECKHTIFRYPIPHKRNRNQSVIIITAHCFPHLIGNNQHKHTYSNPQLRPVGGRGRSEISHATDLERYDRGEDVRAYQFTPKKLPSTE